MPRKVRRLIAVAAVLVGVAGCSGTGNDPTRVDNGGYSFGQGTGAFFPVGHRQLAGDRSGTTLQGAPIKLSDYRGKYVVVNFWSVGCGPCHTEAPAFAALAKSDAKRVQFVGIDERDNLSAALSYEHEYNITYPSIFDRTDAFTLNFPGAVPSTTPFTIVLDPQGRIAAKQSDALDLTHLKELVNRVVTESA
jgi:thiol-disulfide isomerase/thioredoxin